MRRINIEMLMVHNAFFNRRCKHSRWINFILTVNIKGETRREILIAVNCDIGI